MDLLIHLYKNYARISSSDMAANDERLRTSYNAEETIKSLIERINDCADFATAAGEPVSETQLVHISYVLVAETGQYPEDCRSWRNQDDKSWTTFQAHFIEAQAGLRERQQTSQQGGYGAKKLVDIEEAFTNLAQATAEDRVAVTNLTDTNRHLAAQVEAQANNMTTKDNAMETMQKIILQLQGELKTMKSKQAGQSTKNANP